MGDVSVERDLPRDPHPTILDEPAFIVKFADKDMEDVLFSGFGAEDAAIRYFNQMRPAWTVYLFREIARG